MKVLSAADPPPATDCFRRYNYACRLFLKKTHRWRRGRAGNSVLNAAGALMADLLLAGRSLQQRCAIVRSPRTCDVAAGDQILRRPPLFDASGNP